MLAKLPRKFGWCNTPLSAKWCVFVLVAVPEETATSAEVKNQQRVTVVLSEDITLSDHGSNSTQNISESTVRGKSLLDVKRSSTVRCSPTSSVTSTDSAFSQSSVQNAFLQDTAAASRLSNNAASTAERKVPRRVTTRRKRKSTRRVRQRVADAETNEFDDDDDFDADDGEEVEFSETDSEQDDAEQASGSGDSDLEFETELARQINESQVQHQLFVIQNKFYVKFIKYNL